MIGFTPGREQDASPTIRGFRYQIQLTILRWLDLADGELLILECGEDIDRVLRAGDNVRRELEQIKVRSRAITLRTPDALSALANFGMHVKANPDLSLHFRYTTTALIGRERLSPLGKGLKAIDVWKNLQGLTQWTADDDRLHRTLAEMVRNSSCPKDCDEGAWSNLMALAAGQGEMTFADFLSRFEWSCGSSSPENLDGILRDRLAVFPGDTGPDDPTRAQRYDQLTAAVLRLLSSDGEKTLSREQLETTIAQPTLTEHDRARLKLLEEQSASQSIDIQSLREEMEHIQSAESLPLLFGPAAANLRPVDLSPTLPGLPSLVTTLSHRTATVKSQSETLNGIRWLMLHGDFGTGKSHLGFLIAAQRGGVALGVSFRGLTSENAARGLIALMGNSANLGIIASTSGGVVLLDDVPDILAQSRFEFTLVNFAKLILANGHSIISTSRRIPPTTLKQTFGDVLIVTAVPPFSDSDAEELFRAHGVRDEILTAERISTMNSMCRQHPMLLTALARHLVAQPDQPDQALIDALVLNKHRSEIDLEVSRAVLQTVEAAPCRALLYRLASANTAMTLQEIQALASVNPPLTEPTTCIAHLDGLWLRRNATEQFEISPLTAALSRETPEIERREIHGSLARILFARRKLSPTEFIQSISSLLIAGEHNNAALHLIHGCTQWPFKARGYADIGVLLFFPPDQSHNLSPTAELPLRAVQAVSAAIEMQDPLPYINRINNALTNPSPAIAAAALLAGSLMLAGSLERTPMHIALYGASLIERFRDTPQTVRELPSPASNHLGEGAHYVLVSACIRNWDDLDMFVDALGELNQPRRFEINSILSEKRGLSSIIFRCLFNSDAEITENAFARLSHVEDRCIELSLSLLGAYAAGGKLIIIGEYDKDVARMLSEGERACDRFRDDPRSVSVIKATIGKQLELNKRPSEGLKWLSEALEDPQHIVGIERANRLADALSAAWDANEDPERFTSELAEMLGHDEVRLPEAQCQLNAQVAVVRWRQNRRQEALAHLERAVTHFLELEDEMRSRQLGACLAHMASFALTVVITGKPPTTAADGGPYGEPIPKIFSGVSQSMAGFWRVRQGPATLQYFLSRLAHELGDMKAEALWADRAQEAAVKSMSPAPLMMLAPRAVALALRNGEWVDAIEAAITHGRARAFLSDSNWDKSDFIEDDVDFDPLEPPANRDVKQRTEIWTLWLLSRAIVCEVGPLIFANIPADEAKITELAGEIEKVGERSMLTSAWAGLANRVRLSIAKTLPDQQQREVLATSKDPGFDSVNFATHGLLALRRDSRLQQAVVSHVSILHRLSAECPPLHISFDDYSKAVVDYWTEAIQLKPFRFSQPRLVMGAIASASASPALARAKIILRAITHSIGASIAQEASAWLNVDNAETPPNPNST